MVIVEEDGRLTAYVTIEGVVHGVVWVDYGFDWSEMVVLCTGQRSPVETRTALNSETITCVACHARGWT